MRDWLCIVVALMCWGIWTITSKLAVRSMSPLLVQLVAFYVYSSMAPAAYLWMRWRGEAFAWSKTGIFWAGATAVLAQTAVYAFMFAVQNRPVSLVTSVTSAYPVVAFTLAWLVLGEPLTVMKAVGALLIGLGCVLINL